MKNKKTKMMMIIMIKVKLMRGVGGGGGGGGRGVQFLCRGWGGGGLALSFSGQLVLHWSPPDTQLSPVTPRSYRMRQRPHPGKPLWLEG